MGFFSRIKDVASGKVLKQNTLIGSHVAALLRSQASVDHPFVKGWLMQATASMDNVLETVLLGEGIGGKNTDPLNRFRARAKKLGENDTLGMVRLVMGYFLYAFLKSNRDSSVWEQVDLTATEFQDIVQNVVGLNTEDQEFWTDLAGIDEPATYFLKIYERMYLSIGLMPNPAEDLTDSLVFSQVLTLMFEKLVKSL